MLNCVRGTYIDCRVVARLLNSSVVSTMLVLLCESEWWRVVCTLSESYVRISTCFLCGGFLWHVLGTAGGGREGGRESILVRCAATNCGSQKLKHVSEQERLN